jgi:GPH family glycoside/pentoside/hexuronide:cation symporter
MIAVLRNRSFAWLLGAFVVGSLGRALNAALALFFYQHRLALEPQTVFLKVLLPFTFVIAVSILAWAKLSQRVGFVTAAFWGILGLGVMTSIAYPLFPEGAVGPPLAAAVVGGILVGAVFLLDATVATIATADDGRREGLYFGFWRMGGKLARALGLALTGILLHGIGFVEGAAVQSASTREGLALLFGPGVGVCFIAAAVIVRRVRTTSTSAPTKDGRTVVDGAEVAAI